jgi:Uncharacterised nucleotidyltransferase
MVLLQDRQTVTNDLYRSGELELNRLNSESSKHDPPRFTPLAGAPNENLHAAVRRLVADLSTDRAVGPDRCSNWTPDHISTVLSEGIGPWLYTTLQNHPEVGLAAEFMEQLNRSYAETMIRSLANRACFREVVAAFTTEQIPVIVLKGAYLGTFVYKNPALRPMCDLDLLVPDEQFDQARRLLESLGFRIAAEPLDGEYRALQPALAHTRSGILPCAVDLHRDLSCMDHYRLPSSLVWQEAVQGELYGQSVFFLPNELNFIHLGTHALTHVGLIRDWLDLVLFLRRIGVDWNKLASVAGSLGVLRPLYWVFNDLKQDWGLIVPERIADSLAAYVPARMEDRVIRHKLRYIWRIVARFQLLPGWNLRVRYLRMRLFPQGAQGEEGVRILGWLRHMASKVAYFLAFYRHR